MLFRCLVLLAGAALLSAEKHHFEEVHDEPYHNSSRPTSRAGGKGDMVVEKFVETLMSSERYLKMIETVERKLNHLDAAFHERTNSIIKYLAELLRVAKSTSADSLDQSLVSLKGELDKLKTVVTSKFEQQPEQLREDGRARQQHELDHRWKSEYEDELTDAMLAQNRARENFTRIAQAVTHDNDAVIDKLMETITSSEKYLKRVDSMDFRLNRLDIELHEKTNSILKYLTEIMKVIRAQSISDKLDLVVNNIKTDIGELRRKLDTMPRDRAYDGSSAHSYHAPSENTDIANFDHRITEIEGSLKNLMSGMDTILNTLSEVKSRSTRPTGKLDGTPGISQTEVAANLINEFRRTLMEQRNKKCDCKMYGANAVRTDRTERYPTDCHEIQVQGFNVSGIYKIKPDDMDAFYVLCDLNTAGGGWTVFQNRFDGTQDFYKNWWDYKHGFGNLAGEFWLGLDKLYYLTNQKLYELRIEMETHLGQEAYASYSVFTVGPESEGYRISTLGTYYGTGGDSLTYHAGQKFSTPDVDNDEWKDGSCSAEHGGAWWYKECDKSNLNGKHSVTSDETTRTQAVYWISFKGPNVPLHKTKMMIRPLPASRPSDYETRKILETKMLAEKSKGLRKDMRGRPLYRYEAEPHADPFYNNYT